MKQFLMDSITKLDILCWCLVILFFSCCSILFNGNFMASSLAALGVVAVMMFIGMSIEIIIEALKGIKGLGTITGFITNGPEMVCLIVGLLVGDILFAASTPLGSNFMNPLLLAIAAFVAGTFCTTFQTKWKYTLACIFFTVILAVTFYLVPGELFWLWSLVGGVSSLILFFKRPKEDTQYTVKEDIIVPRWLIFPATALLIISGYFLDPVVSYASAQSHAPKGVIGFFVLAILSSWPEFKCCLGLLRRRQHLAAILNITVSNITNIWLATAGIVTYLLLS